MLKVSDVCNFTPKCVKCVENHKDYPKQCRITHECANCGLVCHPESYRGYTKNQFRVESKINPSLTKNTNQAFKETQMFVVILKYFNYAKNI